MYLLRPCLPPFTFVIVIILTIIIVVIIHAIIRSHLGSNLEGNVHMFRRHLVYRVVIIIE